MKRKTLTIAVWVATNGPSINMVMNSFVAVLQLPLHSKEYLMLVLIVNVFPNLFYQLKFNLRNKNKPN